MVFLREDTGYDDGGGPSLAAVVSQILSPVQAANPIFITPPFSVSQLQTPSVFPVNQLTNPNIPPAGHFIEGGKTYSGDPYAGEPGTLTRKQYNREKKAHDIATRQHFGGRIPKAERFLSFKQWKQFMREPRPTESAATRGKDIVIR